MRSCFNLLQFPPIGHKVPRGETFLNSAARRQFFERAKPSIRETSESLRSALGRNSAPEFADRILRAVLAVRAFDRERAAGAHPHRLVAGNLQRVERSDDHNKVLAISGHDPEIFLGGLDKFG